LKSSDVEIFQTRVGPQAESGYVGDLILAGGDGTAPSVSIQSYGWCANWNNIPAIHTNYTVSGLWWGHSQSANCVYLDGHVESKKKSDLSDNNFSGENL